jgi:large subunit ribosomal protein L13
MTKINASGEKNEGLPDLIDKNFLFGVKIVKTVVAKKESVDRKWYVVDAAGQVLGRLASNIAFRLRGKHKPTYTPHVDTGDFIVVVNADKIVLTGKKWKDKLYYRHSGYTGGLKSITAKDLLRKSPTDLIRFAVKGMLPKNRLGNKLIKKLKIYTGSDHPHTAQRPESLEN